jgi:chorismate mutase
MKNQSFHQRKIRIQETPKLDYDQLKSRTVIALNRLGQQKFSNEPGGYSLENWMKGVNILLDDFEEKMGAGRLSPDYVEKRRELNDFFSKPVSTSSIDESISDLKQSEADAENRIAEGRARLVSRVAELKSEQESCSAQLQREQERIRGQAMDQNSGSLLKRLFMGNSKATTNDSGTAVKDLESRLEVLSNEILGQQKLLKLVDQHSSDSPFAEEWKELESLRTKLDALEIERLERVQLVKERVEVTSSIAGAIASLA